MDTIRILVVTLALSSGAAVAADPAPPAPTPAAPAAPQAVPGGPHSCMQAPLTSGATFELVGTVESAPPGGDGWTLKTADGQSHTLHGLGPPWFWQKEGMGLPTVGDTMTVRGRVSDCCCGGGAYVATDATYAGKTIQLRDPETGLPRWRGGPRGTR